MYKTKIKTNQKKNLKGSRGITLIALVITIIVLLILAAVSIATLTGDNGILTKAQEANERTREATAREQIEVEAMGSFDSNGKFNRETFKKRIQDIGGKVLSDDENEIKVELDGYEAVIDAKTGKIKSLVLSGTEQGGGEEDGTELTIETTVEDVQDDKVTITIKVTSEVETVNSMKARNIDSGKEYDVSHNDNDKEGTVEVDSNGTYKIEVEATIGGSQKTGEATETVNKIPVTFTKAYGKIDIIWVNTSNEKIDKPLAPVLNGMKKVYWKDGTEVKEEEGQEISESEWYDYVAGNNIDDSKNSHWANAINTVNGGESYFVWIPRYAYRIIYYADKECTKVSGYCDGDGIREANGTIHNNEDLKTKTGIEKVKVKYNGFNYIVHPAFEGNVANGGWDSDLPGIWVAKYEMSAEGSSGNNISTSSSSTGNVDITKDYSGSIARMVSKPGVTSWRNIQIGNIYTNAMAYDRDKESHLMKNSEWGAVAYLTHSQYGRNGHEITINSDKSFYTGGGSNDAYKTNTNQSSTGNIYGIYDLSGESWEYVAAFNESGSSLSNGSSFAAPTNPSTKYATKYSSGSSTPSYDSYIPGDATYEVFTGSGTKAWFDDYSSFVEPSLPFFGRAGACDYEERAGVFHTYSDYGLADNYRTFRVVLTGGSLLSSKF